MVGGMTSADIKKYLARIGKKGGKAGRGSAAKSEAARARQLAYWEAVRAGTITRKKAAKKSRRASVYKSKTPDSIG
jgi:hypothetical protein